MWSETCHGMVCGTSMVHGDVGVVVWTLVWWFETPSGRLVDRFETLWARFAGRVAGFREVRFGAAVSEFLVQTQCFVTAISFSLNCQDDMPRLLGGTHIMVMSWGRKWEGSSGTSRLHAIKARLYHIG